MVIFGLIFSFLYFDGIFNESKYSSKQNNRDILYIRIYEIILIFTFNFIDSHLILIFVYYAGSILTYHNINSKNTYYNINA
jgi:hypothetical protein